MELPATEKESTIWRKRDGKSAEEVYQQGYDKGFGFGYDHGYDDGYKTGYEQAMKEIKESE